MNIEYSLEKETLKLIDIIQECDPRYKLHSVRSRPPHPSHTIEVQKCQLRLTTPDGYVLIKESLNESYKLDHFILVACWRPITEETKAFYKACCAAAGSYLT